METNAWAFHEPLLPKTQSVNCTLIRKFLTKSRAQRKHWAWFSLPVQHIWQNCKEWKSHQECWSPWLLITRQLQSIFTWNIWGNVETRIHCSGTYYLPGIVQMAYTFVSFHSYDHTWSKQYNDYFLMRKLGLRIPARTRIWIQILLLLWLLHTG